MTTTQIFVGPKRVQEWKMLVFVFVIITVTAGVNSSVMPGVGSNGYENPDTCRRAVKKECVPIADTEDGRATCLGIPLPYKETSFELVNVNLTLKQVRSEMTRWEEGLKSLPRCWAVIQPLLCSFFLPKCNDNRIDLPSQELCKISRNPCRVIEESIKEWPDFLKCDDPDKFAPNCKNTEIRELRFNTSAKCSYPMIPVESSFNHYEGFEGCALQCTDHLFTPEDHEYVSKLIKYLGLATLAATGLVVGTFIIDWHSAGAYPSVIVFYVNCCYFLATIGWMVQFLPNAKEDIVCRKDSTIRRQEPNSGENVFCVLVFILIYYCSMAALAWLVVFAYVWFLTCNAVGRIREKIDKQSVVFHVFCWLTPFVLTVVSVSLSAVDGNSLAGICYVTLTNSTLRITLVIIPIGTAVAVMLIYLWRGVYRLLSVSVSSSDFISSRGRSEIKSNALRVGLFTLGALILTAIFICLQTNEIQMTPIWAKSRRDQLICHLNLTIVAECETGTKPNLNLITGCISIFFLSGLLVSTWAWTGASYRTWKRFITKRFKSENSLDQHQHAVAKHKLISQAFAKRHRYNAKGRLSLSLHSTHEDPVGLNKLLDPTHLCQEIDTEMQTHNNTDAREEISSEWAAAIPSLCTRRDAIIPPHSSNSVSCVSADDSRRPSCDSAMSENVSRHMGTPYEDKKSRRRGLFYMGRRRSGRGWGSGWKRGHAGSSSSLESNAGSQILPAIAALIDKRRRVEEDAPLNNAPLTGPTTRKTIITKEFAVQTSMEKLPRNPKSCNLSNNLTVDMGIQTGRSLQSLNDIGTQTKKSATKKSGKTKDRSDKTNSKTDKDNKGKDENNDKEEQQDALVKLLTPS